MCSGKGIEYNRSRTDRLTPPSSSSRLEEAPMDQSFSTQVLVKEKRRPRLKRQPRYHVLLWNDDAHTYEYVIAMLKQIFGHPVEKSLQLAERVDREGRAILLTTTREHAELKRDQIHAFGKDPFIKDCKGSMSASIEPES